MSNSKSQFPWPGGRKCAVSLTYDDALEVHREKVAPQLADASLTGTFYVCAYENFTEHTSEWREVSKMGHELGNHTLFHPCRGLPDIDHKWLPEHYNLCDYTLPRWKDEIRVANCLYQLIDGQSERTFGNTCCDTRIGLGENEVNLEDHLHEFFFAARGSLNSKIVDPYQASLRGLGHYSADDKTSAEVLELVDEAKQEGGWIIFMIHGVGEGTHNQYMDDVEHAALVQALGEAREEVWTASMIEVAKHVALEKKSELK